MLLSLTGGRLFVSIKYCKYAEKYALNNGWANQNTE